MSRPLSPHLQIYRLPLSAVMSISHRITGVALSYGLVLFLWFLYAIAFGGEALNYLSLFCQHWFGQLTLIGVSFAGSYHFINGVRHIIWDFGYMLDLKSVNSSNIAILIFAALSTLYFAWNILS